MDISQWPAERILQLPDWVFGRKFPICANVILNSGTWAADISEIGFPDPCILWSLTLGWYRHSANTIWARIALGDKLPANDAEVMTFQPLIHGFGLQGPEPRKLISYMGSSGWGFQLKDFVRTGGRHLVVSAAATAAQYCYLYVIAVVCSVPKEVPDWLISDQVKSL